MSEQGYTKDEIRETMISKELAGELVEKYSEEQEDEQ